MDALLSDSLVGDWLAGVPGPRIEVRDEASVAVAREEVRARGAALGMPTAAIEALATAASELGHNVLRHARLGSIAVRELARAGVPGLEVIAADAGPGITDVRAALRGEGGAGGAAGGASGGLGIGLGGVRRLCDELDLETHAGLGTCVRARKLAAPAPRRREVAVLGKPAAGETVSGDVGLFARHGDVLVLAACDGLGHGPLAREPALRAARLAVADAGLPHLEAIDAALAGTRGAAVSVARILEGDEHLGELEWVTLGNVAGHLYRPHQDRALTPGTGYAGSGRPARIMRERRSLEPLELLVLFSDGLTSRASLIDQPDLLHEHPALVAHHLLTNYSRGHDDVLVISVR